MLHSLLLVVWTELCVGSVCTQPPYNDKNPPSVLFLIYSNLYPFFKSSRLSVWCHTDGGPSHNSLIDSSVSAQTALVSYLRPALSELSSVVSLLSSCRQEWLLSYWGVLLLKVIMNIAVFIIPLTLTRAVFDRKKKYFFTLTMKHFNQTMLQTFH